MTTITVTWFPQRNTSTNEKRTGAVSFVGGYCPSKPKRNFSYTLFFIGALQAGSVGRTTSLFCLIATSHFGNKNKMRTFILPFWKWREESLIFVYGFMLTGLHSGHYPLVTRIRRFQERDPWFSWALLRAYRLHPLWTYTARFPSRAPSHSSCLSELLWSWAKYNPMNPSSSLSWCFRSYLSFLPLLTL